MRAIRSRRSRFVVAFRSIRVVLVSWLAVDLADPQGPAATTASARQSTAVYQSVGTR